MIKSSLSRKAHIAFHHTPVSDSEKLYLSPLITGKVDSLEGSFISNSDSGLDEMDGGSNGLTNGTLPLNDAINKKMINPEIKSWRFLAEEAPLVDFIHAGAVSDKTQLSVTPDVQIPVSYLHEFVL